MQDCLDVAGSAMPIKTNKPVLFKVFRICSSLIGYEIVPETLKCSLGQHFLLTDLRENFEIVSVKGTK